MADPHKPASSRIGVDDLVAPLFVLLWSTGFIGARLGLPYAPPLSFLSLRYVIVIGLMLLWVLAARAPWPDRRMALHLAVVGVLLHAGYLGGVFCAISVGAEAGYAALIVGMQPALTALIAGPLLGERLTPLQWTGMALGVAGVALTVGRKLASGAGDWRGVALCLFALAAISLGSLYKKKFCSAAPMRSGAVVEFAAALAVTAPLALALETRPIIWSGEFVFALGWLVFVLSLGAIALLSALLRRGAASKVSSLFFLTPPVAAAIAALLFQERLGPPELAGFALAACGVALVMRGGRRAVR